MAYHFTLDETITRKDDRKITLVFQDAAGAAIDITNYNFWYTARRSAGDDATAIEVDPGDTSKADSGSGTTDSVIISLTSAKTDIEAREYEHDIQMEDANNEFTTIARGTLTVLENITQRVT
jgi:hypothetical protein